MLRFNRVVCAAAVCLIVSAAFGAVVKIKGLTPVGPGLTESPCADGMAIVHYNDNQGLTEINVAITDFMHDTDYYITVEAGVQAALVTTNASGNAHYHGEVGFDVCAFEAEVCVYVWIDDVVIDGAITEGEVRAYGCAPCP